MPRPQPRRAPALIARPGFALRLCGLGLRLHLLLVFAHATQARRVDDVGDGSERTVFAEDAGRLLPAWRLDVELLAEQCNKDLRLLLAESGQRFDALQQLLAVGHAGPNGRTVAAIDIGNRATQLLRALGHRSRESVDGRWLREDRCEILRIMICDRSRVEVR